MNEDQETRKLNRHRTHTAPRFITWCSRCDRNHVVGYGKGRKCSVCGWRADKPHNKSTFK